MKKRKNICTRKKKILTLHTVMAACERAQLNWNKLNKFQIL